MHASLQPRYPFVLLDADRTLFDFDYAQAQALEHAVSEVVSSQGIPYTKDVLELYRKISSHVWDLYEKGEISQKELQTQRFETLFSTLGVQGDAFQANGRYLDQLGEEEKLLDGAEWLCKTLSPYCRLSIVTNGISRSQHRRLEKSALRPYISDLFISEDLGYQKPQKEYFDAVFARLEGFSRQQAIILGDSLASDIAGGIAAGIDTCWYHPSGTSSIHPATYEIHSLYDFAKIVLAENLFTEHPQL